MSDTPISVWTGKLLGLAKGATAAAYATVQTIDANINALDVKINGTSTISGSVTAAQGTAAAAGAPWFVRLSDGASAIAVALDTTVSAMSAKLPAALGITTASGSISVAPASDALFDVKDRAARLLGALTGINGSGVATGANPVPVQLSDGSAVFTGAKTGQLPAALGTLVSSGAVCVVRSVPSIDKQTTLATAGKVVKASAGICYGLTSYFNNTGGPIFFHVYNTIAAPTAGDRPDYFSASIANGTKSSLGFGITALGIGCPTGITFAVSSTQDTFTAIASTAVIYALQYD